MKSIYNKLLILMTLSLSVGYSQDTTIELEHKVARFVIEDLVTGDQAKEELFLTKEQIALLHTKIDLKDSIIFKKDAIISNFEEIIGAKTEQLEVSNDLSKRLKGDLKKQKATNKLYKLGGGGLVAVLLALTIL